MLKWVFGVDSGPFRRGLNDMRKKSQSFGAGLKGIFAGLGIGLGVTALKSFANELDRIDKLAKRFDMGTDEVQKFGVLAKLAGSDLEGIAKGLVRATVAGQDAAAGLETYVREFDKLGIEVEAFNQMLPAEKILELSRAIASADDSQAALAATTRLLGRAGADLLPLLKQGPEELKRLLEEVQVVSEGTIDSVVRFNDQMTVFAQNTKAALGDTLAAAQTFWKEWTLGWEFAGLALTGNVGDEWERYQAKRDKAWNAATGQFEGKGDSAGGGGLNLDEEPTGDTTITGGGRYGTKEIERRNRVEKEKKERIERERVAKERKDFEDGQATASAAQAEERWQEHLRKQEEKKSALESEGKSLLGELLGVGEAAVSVSSLQAAGGGELGGMSNDKFLENRKVDLLRQIAENTQAATEMMDGGGVAEPRG